MAVRMIAVPMSPPSMISPSSMKATGTSGTSMCFHCVEQPLVLFAGEQVGAPQHQRELAELAGLDLEGAAEGDPVLVAVDRHPYPRHLHQAPSGRRTPARIG